MNPAQLLAHFDRISDAPDAILRLRKFILDLAVRGKLIQQNPDDESAADLLSRIRIAKGRTTKQPRNSSEKPSPEVVADELPFNIPRLWSRCRLGDVIHLVGGQHLKPDEYSDSADSGPPYVTGPADFGDDGLVITRYALIRKAIATKGQILLTVKGAGVGKAATCDRPEVAISRQLMAITPIEWSARFLLIVTDRLATVLKEAARSLIPGISREDIENFGFGMPPLAEQHRIVAKVDELMALCDRLEAAQNERESRRDRLAGASLHRLNQPDKTPAFRSHVRFHLRHSDRLITRPDQIPALRQTILNLAIRGKLVPQDPNDEPAAELFKRIRTEQAQLQSDVKSKQPKALPPLEDGDKRFPVPLGWHWFRLRSLVSALGDGLHGTPEYAPGTDCHFINGNNLVDGRIVIKPNTKTVSPDAMQRHRKPMTSNTVLVSINGTLGSVAFYSNENVILGKSACYFNVSDLVDKHFVRRVVESPYFVDYAIENATGTTILNLGLRAMNYFPFPLPPLAEQHRIVAK